MKKVIGILLMVVFSIAIVAGCAAGGGTPTAEGDAPAAPAEGDAPAAPADGDAPAAPEDGGSEDAAAGGSSDEIVLGHLAYHTGPFGHLGSMFDSSIEFVFDIVNENPPLDKSMRAIHSDIGTLGEGQIARQLVEGDKVDILYNPAGEYMSYREWMLEYEAANDGPLMPSIHAGAVDPQYGGTAEEPLFRGTPIDTDMAVVSVLYYQDLGVKSVVNVAVENDGMQMQQEAATQLCELVGIEVLGEIDLQPEQTSYRSEATQLAALNPEAIIFYGAAEDTGTFVKNAAELGYSGKWMGETNTGFPEFLNTATLEAIQAQEFVKYVTLAHAENEAWDYFEPLWSASDASEYADADNFYVLSAYDMLNMTALAIEKAGSVDASAWAPAVHEIAMGPGEKVYNYADGIALLKEGKDIDYEGVTGSCDYSATGVLGGIWQIMDWSTGEMVKDSIMDAERVLELGTNVQWQDSWG